MKRTDVTAVIFIASLSVLVAYFVTGAIIGSPSGETAKVKTATPISATIDQPDPSIFNKDAINPTIEVVIGGN